MYDGEVAAMVRIRNEGTRRAVVPATALSLGLGLVAPGQADAQPRTGPSSTTRLVSLSTEGVPNDSWSGDPVISADGDVAVFTAYARRLDGDVPPHHRMNVYARDIQAGVTRMMSVRWDGRPGKDAADPSVSTTGRYVAFVAGSRLVPRDTNGQHDVYLRDRRRGTTRLVSVSSAGHLADGDSGFSAVSADGRFVAFESKADNLVRHDRNKAADVFVRDLARGTTRRISVSTRGVAGNSASADPAISADGRFVAFSSYAGTLVRGDTNGLRDVFVRDRLTATTRRISVASDGTQLLGGEGETDGPSISGDGRFVAFEMTRRDTEPGDPGHLEVVLVRDRLTATTTYGSPEGPDCILPKISADGRYLAFVTWAALVPGDTNRASDVYLRDRVTDTVVLASATTTGGPGTGNSRLPSVAAHGDRVLFLSDAEDLVPGDANRQPDVFVRDFPFS